MLKIVDKRNKYVYIIKIKICIAVRRTASIIFKTLNSACKLHLCCMSGRLRVAWLCGWKALASLLLLCCGHLAVKEGKITVSKQSRLVATY